MLSRRFSALLWTLVSITVVVTPLVISRGSADVVRTPKDVAFQTLALLIFGIGVAGCLFSDAILATFRTHRPALLVAAAAVLWTAVATLTSLKPTVSFFKPLTVFCLAAFFAAAMWAVWDRGSSAVTAALAPAVVNAIVAFLQSMNVWNPIPLGDVADVRLRTTAFLGNPNEVGSFFVLPAIAAVAAAIAWRNLKWLYALAAIAVAGAVAAQSLTPLIALGCGLAAIVFTPTAKRFRWAGIAVLAVLILAAGIHPGSRARIQRALASTAAGEMAAATSYRFPAYAVAAKMFAERPLVGVGPGVYGALYMPYKLEIDTRFPQWIVGGNENFGQTHNDHLQLLAETGLPGYAIFLTALVLLARLSFRRGPAETARERFVRGFALPAAVAFFVLALAFFPLHVTATIAPAVYLAALCFAWTGADERA